jgi:hypothetical protein
MNDESRASRGVGSFFFAAIPAIIGVAFLIWLSFFSGCFDFKHHVAEVSDEDRVKQRMDNRVGVTEPLSAPVAVTIRKEDCIKVSKAFLDGSSLTAYVTNTCGEYDKWPELHWAARSPDRTIIHQNYSFIQSGLTEGDTAEVTMDIPQDHRIVSVEVWGRK